MFPIIRNKSRLLSMWLLKMWLEGYGWIWALKDNRTLIEVYCLRTITLMDHLVTKSTQYLHLSIFPIVLIFSYLAIASFLVTTITKLNSQSRICHDYIKRRVKMFFNEHPTNRSEQIKLNTHSTELSNYVFS